MKPVDIAIKYRISEMLIYAIIRELRTKNGIQFTKKGHRYSLTNNEVHLIERELQRRGYTPKGRA